MRFPTRAGGLLVCAALWLPGGPAQAGGGVMPNVLQGLFVFNDEDEGDDNCVNIEIDGATHQVTGVVTGIGLADDTVTLTYTTPFVDGMKVKSDRGKVQQNRQAQIDVDVMPGGASPTIAYTATANPRNGRIKGDIRRDANNAKVRVRLQLDPGLSGLFPAPDTDQLNTILAAFETREDVRIQEKNGNVTIRQRGIVNPGTCP